MGYQIPESSRLEVLKKFLPNNFALSDAEDNTSGPLNRKVIADLPLIKVLQAKFLGIEGQPVFMMDAKVSKDKHTGRWVEHQNLIWVR